MPNDASIDEILKIINKVEAKNVEAAVNEDIEESVRNKVIVIEKIIAERELVLTEKEKIELLADNVISSTFAVDPTSEKRVVVEEEISIVKRPSLFSSVKTIFKFTPKGGTGAR